MYGVEGSFKYENPKVIMWFPPGRSGFINMTPIFWVFLWKKKIMYDKMNMVIIWMYLCV